jgi:murein DD-endopeptidase MepM/ murein hydrolase activator NlpD
VPSALVALLALPGVAVAGTGGTYASPAPVVVSISCRTACAASASAEPGSLLRVRGRNLETVTRISFLGGPDPADDTSAGAVRAHPGQLDVRVPRTAATGPLQALSGDGGPSRPSRVALTVGAPPAPDARTVSPVTPSPTGDVFPVQGAHDYGGASARFGAARNGHTHQGQDVLAACGTPLVAVHAGTVRFVGFQSKAGNYVVLAGADTGFDYAYMHLRDPTTVHKGDPIAAGQPIGVVGQTGDATACHLHLEMWSAPGWYRGGAPFDPLPYLQSWDTGAPPPAARPSAKR